MEPAFVILIIVLFIAGIWILLSPGSERAERNAKNRLKNRNIITRYSPQGLREPIARDRVRNYFSFDEREHTVNSTFKSDMKADGEFHTLNERLYEFPAIAAALLKYKRHEWIILGFEKNRIIDKMWINKGVDRFQVHLYIPMHNVAKIAKEGGYSSILVFHNHPNANPMYYDHSNPSSQDIKSANEWASILTADGVNLLEFICERGMHYQYFAAYADKFVAQVNGRIRA